MHVVGKDNISALEWESGNFGCGRLSRVGMQQYPAAQQPHQPANENMPCDRDNVEWQGASSADTPDDSKAQGTQRTVRFVTALIL